MRDDGAEFDQTTSNKLTRVRRQAQSLPTRHQTRRNREKGTVMIGRLANSPVVMAFVTIPNTVIWSYFVFGAILAIGVATMFLRGNWQKARGFDRLILFGPLFYAAPLGAFGTEHFTLANIIASIVPSFIPWHLFWAYFIGACFIAAALSLVTGIQTRLAASLLALTFFLFVVLMDA